MIAISTLSQQCDYLLPVIFGVRLTASDLRNKGRNREDFAGIFVQDDGHVFVASGRCKKRRQETNFGFVEGFGGEERFQFFNVGGIGILDLCERFGYGSGIE
jgi:hypothetical protein